MSGPALQVQVLPSVTINNMTFTAKRPNAPVTISYTNGATAGAEVVSVSGFNITVQIQEGVSTNLQIQTAIVNSKNTLPHNGNSANELVTVTIASGHNSDTNTTFNQAALTGGATAAKAIFQAPNFQIQAVTAGAAGNGITFKFTSGAVAGSEVVTVSTDAISVQIANGVTTVKQLAAAIAASGPASALIVILQIRGLHQGNPGALPTTYGPGSVLASNPYTNDLFTCFTAQIPSYVNLYGGVTAAPTSLTLQGLTITSVTSSAIANGLTVSLSGGGTAGSEVVTVTNGNVNVQIQEGVSTDAQIAAALNASTPFTTLYTVGELASGYALSAYSTITNSGNTIINGDLDLYPAGSITGFPPGIVNGTINNGNTAADNAQIAAQASFTAKQTLGLAGSTIDSALDGQTLTPGAYQFASGAATLAVSGPGTLILNGAGTYIIYTASTLGIGAGGVGTVTLEGGATAANVFFVVGSSATVNGPNVFNGNILASSSISQTGAAGGVYNGQWAALTGAITFASATTVNGSAPVIPNTVNDQVMSGEVAQSVPPDNINESNDGNSFFSNGSKLSLTTSLAASDFGFFSREIEIFNDDAAKVVSFSFDGVNVAGTVPVTSSVVLNTQQPGIWLSSSAAGATYRLIVC